MTAATVRNAVASMARTNARARRRGSTRANRPAIRQEYELILLGRPVSGAPAVNDEASDVAWVTPGDLGALDIHPTQWRQLRDWLNGTSPHVD